MAAWRTYGNQTQATETSQAAFSSMLPIAWRRNACPRKGVLRSCLDPSIAASYRSHLSRGTSAASWLRRAVTH